MTAIAEADTLEMSARVAPAAAPAIDWQAPIDWYVHRAQQRTRKKGVLGGLVVIAIGVPFLLQAQGVPNAPSYLFVALGAAFLMSYLRGGRSSVYLVPGMTLASFGFALLIPTWIAIPPSSVTAVFLGALAAGLSGVVAIEPARRWMLVPAGALLAVAVADQLWRVALIPAALQSHFVPIVLMSVGAYLLVEREG